MASPTVRVDRAPSTGHVYQPFAHRPPSRFSVIAAATALPVTVLLFVWFIVHTFINLPTLTAMEITWLVLTLLAATALAYSSGMYLLGSAGALGRLRKYHRTGRAELDATFAEDDSTMTVLVPSYPEEPRVVSATLWSAALQEFPSLRVVLLIDDKPYPADPSVLEKLDATRLLPTQIATALEEPHAFSVSAFNNFSASNINEVRADDLKALATTYAQAAEWLRNFAANWPLDDHADAFLVDQIFLGLATEFSELAQGFRDNATNGTMLSKNEIESAYVRLVRIFSCKLDLFERKRYISLSQEANKAMNLNSYLSLMGQAWNVQETAEGDVLVATTEPAEADYIIPGADYILTLDADSLLVRDYCTRLVHELRQPGNERVAVIQTPYCSFPGAPTRVERVAGATTDLQHIHHLGKTRFNATFWVGANAIIRSEALAEIKQTSLERGFEVHTYIQDRTVIEDTESSMDLAARGWNLLNYPERLSYSATPPDFGSLVVQRRRWANGGLIIMPKIFGVVRGKFARRERIRIAEIALRVDYLGSIAWTSAAVPVLMLLPLMGTPVSPFLFLIAIPYLLGQAADLRRAGHWAIDVLWVQALNIVLLPVNLAGVLKSIQQGITKRKIPFARTPKVADRVAAPALFVVIPFLMSLAFAAIGVRSVLIENFPAAVFAFGATLLTLVGSLTFIGLRAGTQDIVAAIKQGRSPKRARPISAQPATVRIDPTPTRPTEIVSAG